jgi:hypothetical protein
MGAVLRARRGVARLLTPAGSGGATANERGRSKMIEERSGWVTFAGILLMLSGILNVVYGIAGVGKSHFFNQNAEYIVSNLKTWGWISLCIGIIQVLAAASLWRGGLFGRVLGIFAASLAAIAALLSIPAYPFWSLAIFALSIVIIQQIAVHGAEGRDAGGPSSTERAYEGMAEYKQ